ncbi:MAG TPA: hypothetical protein PK867_28575 [Pirellulales bacterium]|nr:hypothetical protein [Pirellulales bacterium]
MSKLATVVGALSAIVTLVDYLAAKSFLSHWLQRQIRHDEAGWHISPTLNLLFIGVLVLLIWLATDSPASEPPARKRLFRLRAQLVMCGLAVWFLLGPAIADVDVNDPSVASTSRVASSIAAGGSQTVETQRPLSPAASGNAMPGATHLSQGHTSQFTWHRPVQPSTVSGVWKPGDGLRAMARLLESASATPTPHGR